MRKLIVYPNCSKGGICSVIRARARAEPRVHFDLVFFFDRGGKYAYDDIDNVSVRIVRKDRAKSYLTYVTKTFTYEEVSILSDPESANTLSENPELVVTYEFHTSNIEIIRNELSNLNIDKIACIAAPSTQMVELIKEIVPPRIRFRTLVKPNAIDLSLFKRRVSFYLDYSRFDHDHDGVPLLWVGRFDGGKGYPYFLRALAMLPKMYYAIIVVSLENDISRINNFFAECYAAGVQDRVRILLDLPQPEMADLYLAIGKRGGFLISTSLMESFGYAVLEALESGVNVVAFDLAVWDNFKDYSGFSRVCSGDVQEMVCKIKQNFQSRPASKGQLEKCQDPAGSQ